MQGLTGRFHHYHLVYQYLGELLARYVSRGKLSEQQAELFARAGESYLKDRAHSVATDPLPVYFREVIPDVDSASYQKSFKNIFDTMIKKAITEFENRLRELL